MLTTSVLNNAPHYRYVIIQDDINTRYFTPLLIKKIVSTHNECIVVYDKDMNVNSSIDSIYADIAKENRVIILDLSSLVWRFTLSDALSLVYRLIKDTCVICVVHKDVHLPSDLSQIENQAHAIIRLVPLEDLQISIEGEEKMLDRSSVHFSCDVKSIRNKSKLVSGREYFRIIDDREGVFSHVKEPFVSIKKKAHDGDRPMNQEDIDRQVPFKISMSAEEKRRRDNATVTRDAKKGFIIIDDEQDDSDPDEDLDI